MNPDVFIQSFPEFVDTTPVLINAKLLQASARMGGPDPTVWPAFAVPGQNPSISDIAQGNLAAHYLLTSPFGTQFRIDPKKGGGKTPYWEVWEELELAVAGGFMTSGERAGIALPSSGATGSLVLAPGNGKVAVVNGSTAITFQYPQTLPAGTILAFVGTQNGALYALYLGISSATSATLTAIYTGVSNPASSFNVGAG